MPRSKEEAEKIILAAYKEVADRATAVDNFARACHKVHDVLSDNEIAKLINFGYSRSRIQQWRKRHADSQDDS